MIRLLSATLRGPFHVKDAIGIATAQLIAVGICRVGKMAKSKRKLEVVHLVCEETGDYNYTLRRKTGGEKLKLKKFCPRLRKHTVHVEKKK